jgi:hypothetical protein
MCVEGEIRRCFDGAGLMSGRYGFIRGGPSAQANAPPVLAGSFLPAYKDLDAWIIPSPHSGASLSPSYNQTFA